MDNFDRDKYLDEARDRIFDLLKSEPITQREFAAAIGVVPQTITDWKKGKSRSYMQKIPLIAAVLHSSSDWICDGIGDKSAVEDKEHQAFENLLKIAYDSRFIKFDGSIYDDDKTEQVEQGEKTITSDVQTEKLVRALVDSGIDIEDFIHVAKLAKTTTFPDEGPAQPYLVMRYNSLPPEVQEEVMAFIEFKAAQASAKRDGGDSNGD